MFGYENARRECGQPGYRVFPVLRPQVVDTPMFKQFVTVVGWLDRHHWKVGWDNFHWQGYVEHVFATFSPNVPMPGQLKNDFLLSTYMKSIPEKAPEGKSLKEMEEIYRDVLHPSLVTDQLMTNLGLFEDDGDQTTAT